MQSLHIEYEKIYRSWSEWQSKKFGSDSTLYILEITCAWFELIRRRNKDCMDADIEWDTVRDIMMDEWETEPLLAVRTKEPTVK